LVLRSFDSLYENLKDIAPAPVTIRCVTANVQHEYLSFQSGSSKLLEAHQGSPWRAPPSLVRPFMNLPRDLIFNSGFHLAGLSGPAVPKGAHAR
jgi:hypothetical protein